MATETRLFIPGTRARNGEDDRIPLTEENSQREQESQEAPQQPHPQPQQRTRVIVVTRQRNQRSTFCARYILFRLVVAIIALFLVAVLKVSHSSWSSSNSYTDDTPTTYDIPTYNPYPSYPEPYDHTFGLGMSSWPTNFDLTPELDSSCTGNTCDNAAQEILNSLNTSVDPCDNFYEFSCQGWEKRNPRPDYIDEWSVFSKVEKRTSEIVIEILKEPINPSDLPALTTAKHYFRECVKSRNHTDRVQQNQEMEFIWNKLEEYGGWPILYKNGTWDPSLFDWTKSVAGLKKEFDSTELIDVLPFQSPDGKISGNSIILNTPSDGSSSQEPQSKELKKAIRYVDTYQDFIVNVSKELLSFKGKSYINETYLKAVALQIVTVQLEFSLLKDEKVGNSFSTYGQASTKDYTIDSLQTFLNFNSDPLFTGIDILTLLKRFYAGTDVSVMPTQSVYVPNMQYLIGLSNKVTQFKVEAVANYLQFQMILQMIPLSNVEKFKGYLSTLKKTLADSSTKFPTDQVCAGEVKRKLPFVMGHAFVRRINMLNLEQSHSSAENFTKLRSMFENIKLKYLELASSTELPYINKTFTSAKIYLTNICPGYPSWLTQGSRVQSEYSKLDLSTGLRVSSSFMEHTIVINKWATNKRLMEITQPGQLDECKWTNFPGIIDAFHKLFSVYVPLGMLQTPFYDENLPKSLNYGKLGAIIGHEIGHGIVGQGWSQYKDGSNTPIGECIVNQYNSYSFESIDDANLTVNGRLTLTENLADNAGILAAFKAYKEKSLLDSQHQLKGLQEYSNDQLFYIGFAQNWCETATEEGLRISLETDVHSPGKFRVLGTLQNSKEFREAWNCPVGSKMNPEPEYERTKCTIF